MPFRFEKVEDLDPDPSYLDQEGFEDRKAAFERGDFGYVGVRAKVNLMIPQAEGGHRLQVITSGGLWGIESDSDDRHFKEVGQEELQQLKDDLTKLGVSPKAAEAAINKAEWKR